MFQFLFLPVDLKNDLVSSTCNLGSSVVIAGVCVLYFPIEFYLKQAN